MISFSNLATYEWLYFVFIICGISFFIFCIGFAICPALFCANEIIERRRLVEQQRLQISIERHKQHQNILIEAASLIASNRPIIRYCVGFLNNF